MFDDSRSRAILGDAGCDKLRRSHVAIFGLGGVGGHLCEALARAGVGKLTVIDGDTVAESNLNRQLIATQTVIGLPKSEVMAKRIREIDPDIEVVAKQLFYLPENADSIDFSEFDFVADAVDTVAAKLEIICRASHAGIPVISSMGAGNKLYPERFRIGDIYSTHTCPLAKIMRKKLRQRGIGSLPVVWSDEEPRAPFGLDSGGESRRSTPASLSFVPSVAGLLMAGFIVRKICNIDQVQPNNGGQK